MRTHLTPRQLLTDFTLEVIEQQAPERALLLYRAMAATTTSPLLQQRVTDLADQIEGVQRAQVQLRLDILGSELVAPTSGDTR